MLLRVLRRWLQQVRVFTNVLKQFFAVVVFINPPCYVVMRLSCLQALQNPLILLRNFYELLFSEFFV